MQVALTGDVMLGRLVDQHVIQNRSVRPDALWECVTLLDEAGITRTGAGATLQESLVPASVAWPQGTVTVVALTDNEPEWEATATKPGVTYVAYDERGLIEPYRSRMVHALSCARQQAGLVIVSAHVGPNWGAPSSAMQALTHDPMHMGADLYWGHSNHTPQGIECYKGNAILYSTGDFVDDYLIDQEEHNNLSFLLSFLFILDVEGSRIARIRLHPTCIQDLGVRLATEQEASFLKNTMSTKCTALGVPIEFDHHVGMVTID